MKMWSGRFGQSQNAGFEQWQRSFPFDRVLLPFEVPASQAHAAALAKAGVLNAEEFARTVLALEQIAREEIRSVDDPSIEDVHHYVELRLIDLAGEAGYKLHSGRSRNEQVATDLRLYVRKSVDSLQLLLADWLGILLERARKA